MNEVLIKGYFYMKTNEDTAENAVKDFEDSYPGIEIGQIDYAVLRDEDGVDIDRYNG